MFYLFINLIFIFYHKLNLDLKELPSVIRVFNMLECRVNLFKVKQLMRQLKLSFIEQILQQLNENQRGQFNFFFRQNRKNLAVAYFWLICFGIFGIHKFYLHKRSGWIYLAFCWTFIPAILAMVDVFLLPFQVHKYNLNLANQLAELINTLNNNANSLTIIDDKLQAKRVLLVEWGCALIIICFAILPAIAYVKMRMNAQHLEIHYKTDKFDGSNDDHYLVL